jgi:hypothetical protein
MRSQHRSGPKLTIEDLEMIANAKIREADGLPDGPERLELLEYAHAVFERAEMRGASRSDKWRLN